MLKYYKDVKNMATPFGNVEIKDGIVKGLTKTQEKEFANLPGFEYTEDKQETKKEEPKKTTPKKTTTRKTSTKKQEDKEEDK